MSDQERIAFREWIKRMADDEAFYHAEMARMTRDAVVQTAEEPA